MNRFATALYPSIPSSSSEGSSTNITPQDSARGDSPTEAPLSSIHTLNLAKSIYDDPRSTRFPTPAPGTGQASRAHSDSVGGTGGLASRASGPNLLRRLTDEYQRNGGVVPSPSSTGARVDRSLRVNLMQIPTKGKARNTMPAPACGGRLNSMAKGPGDRYVVGGGQYDSPKDSSPKSIRQAGTPFARGPGGVTVSEVVNFWKGSWAIGKGVNDVDWVYRS
ncbi:uncharacterized protein EHS24_009729, partial [Apiotrichum porosum]